MNKSLSLYLDVWRFAAAMIVFLSHVASQKISGGLFWQTKAYDQTAVMIFFVMSGFVIAFVTEQKEKRLSHYTIARISRLYSVLIPALIITIIFDYIGFAINPDFYLGGPWPFDSENLFTNYFLSFFMVQNVWNLGFNPGINQPFWSLSFEWIYYIIFACAFFLKSKWKYLLLTIIGVIAGPTILALLPIWIAGFVLYKAMQNDKESTHSTTRAALSLTSLILLVIVGPEVRSIEFESTFIQRKELFGDYFDALMFCVHIYFSPALLIYFAKVLERFERSIRWMASLTFALYLFHRPIIQTIAAVNPYDNSHGLYLMVLIFIPLVIVVTLGRWAETQKYTIKNLLVNKFKVTY
ncbi:acyltransferase [Psychrosphaera haliotis]|nr:acyltransferase [Psychrosphaera haliotis]